MVFGQACRYAGATIMAYDEGFYNAEELHKSDNVLGHGSLVVAGRRLAGSSITTQVRDNDAIALCQNRNLVTPGKPGFRETMQEDHRWTITSFHIMHADAIEIDSVVLLRVF